MDKSKIKEIETLLEELSFQLERLYNDAEKEFNIFKDEEDVSLQTFYGGKMWVLDDVLHIVNSHFRNDMNHILEELKEEHV